MVRKSEKVEPLSIKNIEPIFNHIFNNDDIKRISKSVKDIGYEPLIVRPKGNGKYQLCSHPEIFEALKLLGKDTVDVIVRDITEQQGKELALASLLSHPDISSKDQELLVWHVRNSGNYKSDAELGRKIGKSDRYVSDKCYCKESREEIFGPEGRSDHISTDTLRRIRTLSLPEQKKFCDRIKDGGIKAHEARGCVKFFKTSCSKDHKKAILEGIVTYKEAKYIIEKRFGRIEELLDKVKRKYKEKRTLQDAVQEERIVYSAEVIRELTNFIKEMGSLYIDNIPDETERKQADRDIDFWIALLDRMRFKRGRITHEKYCERIKELDLTPEDVEYLKEDGHSPFFESEYQTPKEEELIEKSRKLDTTRGNPLKVLA